MCFRRLPSASCLPVALMLLLAAGCASHRPDAALTHGEAVELRRIERTLARSRQRIIDPALESYVRALLARLDAAAAARLRIYLIDDPALRADLVGNQLVQLHLGLLLRVEDEAELIFLLAHELAHLKLDHLVLRRRSDWDATAAEIAADLWARERLSELGYDAGAGLRLMRRLPRSQASERQVRARLHAMAGLPSADPAHRVESARLATLLAPYRASLSP